METFKEVFVVIAVNGQPWRSSSSPYNAFTFESEEQAIASAARNKFGLFKVEKYFSSKTGDNR